MPYPAADPRVPASRRARGARLAALASTAALLLACGGGGSSGPPPATLPSSLSPSILGETEPGATVVLRSNLEFSVADTTGLTLRWDFGDGTSSVESRPSHVYTVPGVYTVVLTVSNSAGASISARSTIDVASYPNVEGRICDVAPRRGWCWQNPRPSYEETGTPSFPDLRSGWVGGRAGFLAKVTAPGLDWERLPRVDFDVLELQMADSLQGWARSADATSVMRTRDGARTWQRQVLPLPTGSAVPPAVTSIAVYGADRAVVTHSVSSPRGSGSAALVTIDGGSSWRAAPAPSTRVLADGTWWSASTPPPSPGGPEGRIDHVRVSAHGAEVTAVAALPACTPALQVLDAQQLWAWCRRSSPTVTAPALFRSGDGGASWRAVSMELPRIGATWHVEGLALSAAGDGAMVLVDDSTSPPTAHALRGSDGGQRWVAMEWPAERGTPTVPAGPVIDDTTAWLVTGSNAYLSDDRGRSWRFLANFAEAQAPLALVRDGGGGLLARYADASGLGVRHWRSTDEARTWQRVPGHPTVDGLHYDGAGQVSPHGPMASVRGIWMFDNRRGLVVMASGVLADTSDGGQNWSYRYDGSPPAPDRHTGHLLFTPGARGWMIDRGQLKTSTDQGRTWAAAGGAPELADAVAVQFLGDARGWLVGRNGRVFTTGNGGTAWSTVAMPAGRTTHLRFVDERIGVAVVNDGSFDAVWRTTDGGASWRLTNFQGHSGEDLQALRWADATNAWMIGGERTRERVWRSSDAGATWRAVDLGVAVGWTELQFVDANRGWLIGQQGVVLATRDGGQTWEAQAQRFVTAELRTMFWRDHATGWIGGDHSLLLATATGGR